MASAWPASPISACGDWTLSTLLPPATQYPVRSLELPDDEYPQPLPLDLPPTPASISAEPTVFGTSKTYISPQLSAHTKLHQQWETLRRHIEQTAWPPRLKKEDPATLPWQTFMCRAGALFPTSYKDYVQQRLWQLERGKRQAETQLLQHTLHPATTSIRLAFDGKFLSGTHSAVLSLPTAFQSNVNTDTPGRESASTWPCKAEFALDGDDRQTEHHGLTYPRCLPIMRIRNDASLHWTEQMMLRPHAFDDFEPWPPRLRHFEDPTEQISDMDGVAVLDPALLRALDLPDDV